MAKLLLIEDDRPLCAALQSTLSEIYAVEVSYDGVDAQQRLDQYSYDIIIMDWQLPFISGPELCATFRQKGGMTPVLMLTGQSALADKERGFDSGADDYLTKPFEMAELKVRLKALLRRPPAYSGTSLVVGDLSLDSSTKTVQKQGLDLKLSPKEFALLEYFMRRPGVVASADVLLNAIWTADENAGPETIRVHIRNLRAKLNQDQQESGAVIKTVFGLGYKLESDNK